PVKLTPAAQKFVLHWGEMGQAWGINRTMAQVHALLFVSPEALDAEEISRLLDVSRSNVSTSLRELITWGVVRRVHIIGDRRDRRRAPRDSCGRSRRRGSGRSGPARRPPPPARSASGSAACSRPAGAWRPP